MYLGDFPLHEHQEQARRLPRAVGSSNQSLSYSNQLSGAYQAPWEMVLHRQLDLPWWSETQGSTGRVRGGWPSLEEYKDWWNPDKEDKIGPRWSVFHRPWCFFCSSWGCVNPEDDEEEPLGHRPWLKLVRCDASTDFLSSHLALPSPMWIPTLLVTGWVKTIISYSHGTSLGMEHWYFR